MSKYMHTIDNRPAAFCGDQICFAWQGVPLDELLVASLAKIRQQQRESAEYRARYGMRPVGQYGYLRIKT